MYFIMLTQGKDISLFISHFLVIKISELSTKGRRKGSLIEGGLEPSKDRALGSRRREKREEFHCGQQRRCHRLRQGHIES